MVHITPFVLVAAAVGTVAAGGSKGGSTKKKTCKVPYVGKNKDNSQAILDTFTKCSSNAIIEFEEPYTYHAWTPMSWVGLSNVDIHLNGNLDLPSDIPTVQQKINATSNQPSTYATPWFYIHGSNVNLVGSKKKAYGQFQGHGQQWWDIGLRILRPQLATFNVSTGTIQNIKVIKPVAWGFNVPGTNVKISNHFVDAAPNNGTRDQTTSFPFNTDGFNLSGQNITLDGYYGHNGDDCVSVVNGARNIVAKNGYCGFSSHGLSIGSLGRGGAVQTVANVVFDNWTMEGAVYAARFKSWTGGQGWAKNVTWRNIKALNVSTAIFITQNYFDQDKGPRPNNTSGTSTSVDNFLFENFEGSLGPNWTDGTCISNPCWNYVQGGDATQSIIMDLYPGTATNLHFKNIKVHPYKKPYSATTVICDPATLAAGEQDTLGFKCQRGPYVATKIKGSH
ncbi:hypothetical protein FRC04_008597 [Tulasnella sp. 424]|nr:hypothetical protein FRC04_008597 [Tulasnella sp. 424]KAG8965687.1 hypothetical protein FRC05_003075 [Tulasnella sp. 425]